MKSLQTLLLLCIHLNEGFPPTIHPTDRELNLAHLRQNGYIDHDFTDMVTGYEITEQGKAIVSGIVLLY